MAHEPEESVEATHRELVELAARFSQSFGRLMNQPSEDDGLNYHRLGVLEILHCTGPSRMKDLAEALSLSARNLTSLADGLEAEGLVQRAAHPEDRRATLLELTDQGFDVAHRSLEPRLSAFGQLFDRLPAASQRRLASDLRILVEAMDEPCDGSD